MKTGRSLDVIAKEIVETKCRREDFIAPGVAICMSPDGTLLNVGTESNYGNDFRLADVAHGNLAKRLEIPKMYYDRMRTDAPRLLAGNVNEWLERSQRHMIRTLTSEVGSGTCRAVLSDRYKIIDNDFVMDGLMPVLMEQPGMIVESAEITETQFYIKARFPELEREIKLNDAVQAGVIIRNSEVGYGAASVSMLIYRLKCLNGMKIADRAFSARKNHIGRVLEHDENFSIIQSDETARLKDETFLSQLRDVIKVAADPDVFHDVAASLQDAAAVPITGNIEDTVEKVTKYMSLTKAEGESVLENLVRDHDYSKWGLANAVTRMSQDVDSYDRASELEAVGGKIIDLKANEWMQVAA
jgi:hypothetical protein